MRRLAGIVGLAMLVAAVGYAEGLHIDQVAGSAQWVVHLDAEAFRASQLGGSLLEGLTADAKAMARLSVCRNLSGVDPMTDIAGVTIYGQDAEHRAAVALVKGSFVTDKIMDLLRANAAYERTIYGAFTIHKWNEHDKDGYVCVFDPGLAVVGGNLERVKAAVDVLNGMAPALSDDSPLARMLQRPGVFLFASAKGLNTMPGVEPRAVMLKNSENTSLVVAETDGQVHVDVSLTACSQEAADQIASMLQGMIAYGQLSQDQAPVLSELMQSAELAIDGKNITFGVSHPAVDLAGMIKAHHEQRKSRHHGGQCGGDGAAQP